MTTGLSFAHSCGSTPLPRPRFAERTRANPTHLTLVISDTYPGNERERTRRGYLPCFQHVKPRKWPFFNKTPVSYCVQLQIRGSYRPVFGSQPSVAPVWSGTAAIRSLLTRDFRLSARRGGKRGTSPTEHERTWNVSENRTLTRISLRRRIAGGRLPVALAGERGLRGHWRLKALVERAKDVVGTKLECAVESTV